MDTPKSSYYAQNKEEILVQRKDWYKQNPEKARIKAAKYRQEHPDKIKAYRAKAKLLSCNVKLWKSAKTRAKARGLDFSITANDVVVPEFCPVLGIKLESGIGGPGAGPISSSPSLDRVDTARGYVLGNIRVISWRANRIKSDATVEELEKVLLYMKTAGSNEIRSSASPLV